jgi:hypothetical protein
VLHVGEAHQRRARIHVQLVAAGGEHRPHPHHRILVLLPLLRRGEKRVAEPGILGGVAAARCGPAEHQRAHVVVLAPDQQFGGGTDQVRAGEGVAVGVAVGEPPQDDPDVEVAGRGRVEVAGEDHLAELAGPDAIDRGGDGALPAGRGQAPVVPADLRGHAQWRGGWRRARGADLRRTRRQRADGGEPGSAAPAPDDRLRHHEHRAVGGGVEGEAAEGDRPAAGLGHLVVDLGAVEERPEPLLAGGEPVLARGERDPGCLAPPGQAVAVADPGHAGRLGEQRHQVAWVGHLNGPHGQPFRRLLTADVPGGCHARQLYVDVRVVRPAGIADAGPGHRPPMPQRSVGRVISSSASNLY